MNMKQLRYTFKSRDGGVIKFKDQYQQKTFYFEIDYETAFPVIKKLAKKETFILLLSSDRNHRLFENIEDIRAELDYEYDIEIGSIIKLDNTYGIADQDLTLDLFDHVMNPDLPVVDQNEESKYVVYSHHVPKQATSKQVKSYSILSTKKPVQRERFDWHDAYLEGLRIHGNIDDAEAHADDEELKHKRKHH